MSTATEDETAKAATAAAAEPDTKTEQTETVVAAAAAAIAASAAAAAAVGTPEVPAGTDGTPVVLASPQPQSGSRVSLLSDVDGQGKRRFFPRVKHLIGNKEWEDFLTQVLQCIEEAGAPEASSASHKANNAWYKAFDLIYGGVAREYSIPTGKNRYHKFKDKILEVWVALEGQAPGENHCRELSMDQYDRYKRACAEASKTATTSAPVKAGKTGAGQTASGAYKLTGGKRSYSTAMGGGASLPASNFQSGCLWKNLDESKVLEGLPPKLRSLVHLKQLSKEMAAGTANRAARRGIEEHSKKLDGAYLEALTEFLKDGEEEEAAPTPATEEATDVEMTDEKTEEEPSSTDNEKNGDEETKANDGDDYDRCLTVAFLYRYASTLHEQKVLAEAYAKYTAKCVTFPKSAVAAVAVADSAAAAATGANPSSVADGVKEEATATEDAAVAAAAAVAMEEEFPVEI